MEGVLWAQQHKQLHQGWWPSPKCAYSKLRRDQKEGGDKWDQPSGATTSGQQGVMTFCMQMGSQGPSRTHVDMPRITSYRENSLAKFLTQQPPKKKWKKPGGWCRHASPSSRVIRYPSRTGKRHQLLTGSHIHTTGSSTGNKKLELGMILHKSHMG